MSRAVVLDAGVLSDVVRRPGHPLGDPCRLWMGEVLRAGGTVFVAEVADYEVRREMLRIGQSASVGRLDRLGASTPGTFLPITRAVMLRAAELWADVRNRGVPTADPASLDADMILAAQYQVQVAPFLADPSRGVVATTNVKHLSRVVPAERWESIAP